MSNQLSTEAGSLAEIKPEEVADSLKKSEVLVVDDSRLMRMVLTKALQDLGFTNIDTAVDGRDAINKLLEKPYDLMLLDMEMPEMNGLEVLTNMNFDSRIKGTPTIVISGNEQIDLAVQCIEAGAEDYLIKPPNPTLLRARVSTSLEKKRLRNLDKLRFAQLQAEKELLEFEKEKSERLLLNILPGAIAGRLKGGEKTIANGHHIVSVMFADLCGFTALSRKTTPDDLVRMLNEIFTAFDNIVENHRVEKIKTIGDCYMLVGGLPNHRDDHAHAVADAAIEMVEALETINKKKWHRACHAYRHSLWPSRGGRHREDQIHLRPLGRYRQCRKPHGILGHARTNPPFRTNPIHTGLAFPARGTRHGRMQRSRPSKNILSQRTLLSRRTADQIKDRKTLS